ncbi:MAG: ExeM/NucH family extracellular endonuclease [Psychrobium sp.]
MKINPLLVSLCLSTGLVNMAVNASEQKTIMEIQGAGSNSPFVDIGNKKYQSKETFQVTGVITHIQAKGIGRDIPSGLYIQDPKGDNNPATSDGLFVSFDSKALSTLPLQVGQTITATGKIKESYHWTQLAAQDISISSEVIKTLPAIPVTSLATDTNFSDTLERFEGMHVTIASNNNLIVSRNFGYDRNVRRNNLALAAGSINFQPNQQYAPSSKSSKQQAIDIKNNELIVESLDKAPAGKIPWFPSFAQSANGVDYDYIRIGDSVADLTGVVGYSHNNFRLFVQNTATNENFTHNNPRTVAPTLKEADIKVATFNVLNYFNSPFGGDKNPLGQNRGAKTNEEFSMQRAKIVKAIIALDADIIGLMEIENNGTQANSALNDLLSHINKGLPIDKQYTFATNNEKYNGTGAITSQVIYRGEEMSLAHYQVIAMPQQDAPTVGKENGKNFMRNAVTPTFKLKKSGELLTVSVNHFKSKGSTCWEDVALQNSKDVDHQGSCEHFRVSGAYHLGQALEKIEGHKLIIGDLNSYALEDPLAVLTNRQHLPDSYKLRAARDTFIGGDSAKGKPLHGKKGAVIEQSFGYINTIRELHPEAFGYSFSNVVGTLDYILASPSLADHIVDATEWNINSPESTLFEYGTRYTGNMKKFADVYRSSDHDPVIISLNFNKPSKDNSGNTGIAVLLLGLGLLIRRKITE